MKVGTMAENLIGSEIFSKHPHTSQIQSSLNDYTLQLLDKCLAQNGTEALDEIQVHFFTNLVN